ncbi:MAG: hypothetical protein JWO06_917 [Bacteroidota bacterium]|nr:hypothetical protein [Bacteroidota bacterium]
MPVHAKAAKVFAKNRKGFLPFFAFFFIPNSALPFIPHSAFRIPFTPHSLALLLFVLISLSKVYFWKNLSE